MVEVEALRKGLKVQCPARRGKKAYTGEITWVDTVSGKAGDGQSFRWVTVRDPKGKEENLPSNRLGLEGT